MSFRYTTGLQNVGSYQVSGRPWMKTVAFTGIESKFYEFPNVTDYIKVMNDVNGTKSGNIDIVFCEPRRGLQMANAGTNPDVSYSASGFSLTEFSISLWIKITDVEITKFFDLKTAGGNSFRVQIHSTTGVGSTRFIVNNQPSIVSGVPFSADQYYNIICTFSNGDSNFFVNNVLTTSSTESFSDPITNITLGSTDTNGFDGVYEQVLLFNKALTKSEASSVYSAYESISNLDQSLQDSIVARYEFEDNTYKNFFPVADTTTTIQDRAGVFNLSRTNTATEAFVDGRALVNALSHHKITLVDQQEITLNCKAKQIFLRSTGDADVSICAGLTAIPAERMYELTGPGIDE
jgi:hypothetical protein